MSDAEKIIKGLINDTLKNPDKKAEIDEYVAQQDKVTLDKLLEIANNTNEIIDDEIIKYDQRKTNIEYDR